jgi:hypothetical protein
MKLISCVGFLLMLLVSSARGQGCYSQSYQTAPPQTYSAPPPPVYSAPPPQTYAAPSGCYGGQYSAPAPSAQSYSAPPTTYMVPAGPSYAVNSGPSYDAIYFAPPPVTVEGSPVTPYPYYRAPLIPRPRIRRVFAQEAIDTEAYVVYSAPPPLFPRLSAVTRGTVGAIRGSVYGAFQGAYSSACPGGVCR